MSTREELEEFEYQLETTEQTLKDDPDNADLLSLKEELTTLIALTKEYLGQQSASSSSKAGSSKAGQSLQQQQQAQAGQSSKPTATFTAGTDVLAKWHVDNKMYPARIVSVSGSASDPVYTVIFKVDNSTEVVRSGDVKALSESRKRAFDKVDSLNDKDAADSGSEKDGKKAKKVEKKQAKEEDRKARVAEQNAKQSSWQSFAKKGAKKGYHIPGVSGESQFRSPDNPYGRVGVVGSGKGMTNYEQKKRAVWEAKE